MPPWTKRESPWLDGSSKTRSNAGLKHIHTACGQTGPELPFVLIPSPPCLSRSVASVPISIMVLPKHRSISVPKPVKHLGLELWIRCKRCRENPTDSGCRLGERNPDPAQPGERNKGGVEGRTGNLSSFSMGKHQKCPQF